MTIDVDWLFSVIKLDDFRTNSNCALNCDDQMQTVHFEVNFRQFCEAIETKNSTKLLCTNIYEEYNVKSMAFWQKKIKRVKLKKKQTREINNNKCIKIASRCSFHQYRRICMYMNVIHTYSLSMAKKRE